MPRKKRTRRTKRKTAPKRKSTKKKLIGYTKAKGGYKLVYGSKTKPKLGSGTYKTKKTLFAKAKKELS